MEDLTRRRFLNFSGAALCTLAIPALAGLPGEVHAAEDDIRGNVFRGDGPRTLWPWSREAMDYRSLDAGRVVCGLCPHRCNLAPGDRGICRARVNFQGRLFSLSYGNPCAVNLDPVEKKPLFHFLPATRAFSIAAAGCNLRCLNCQNWEISQARPEDVRHRELFPHQVVAAAAAAGARSIAYTYSEPITFYEYMHDTAQQARAAGICNLLISAGYINPEPLRRLCAVLDGANLNLKSFSDAVYRRLNGARLEPILETFEILHAAGVHLEITHLVVPGYTDDERMVDQMCHWILDRLGPDHPLHFSRFYPKYKLDRLAPTPVETLARFRRLALDLGLRYVYVGNVPGHEGNHTYCHHCGSLIIERRGYLPARNEMAAGCCRFCGTRIPGVWPDGQAAGPPV
jgi:pyruvate formate lyase activating enzyme